MRRTDGHIYLLASVALVLTGCVSAGDSSIYATSPGFAPSSSSYVDLSSADESDALMMASRAEDATQTATIPESGQAAAEPQPQQAQPGSMVMAETSVDALNRGITQAQPAQPATNLYSAPATAPQAPTESAAAEPEITPDPANIAQRMASAELPPATAETEAAAQAAAPTAAQAPVQELAVVAPPKKQSIFARLFAPQQKSAKAAPAGTKQRVVSPKAEPVVVASASGGATTELPGVRMSNVFDIGSSEGDGEDEGPIEVASAAGLARLAPNGLHLQTEKVEVGCFKPELVRVLKGIERHYGRPLVVTSGYRSPRHNRKVGGASGSRHTTCEAADIQIEGVSKWQLAKYLRSMPDRGGVGTYCHTESVHIDVGTPRDWNWRCRRRK
ncbi:D-Ala-D-Ala carboxypeptidase family metallohydrolase [Hoeflea olei]|uniref:Peptidase M15A C-terminal domain-containing protein n=1 Tax=Hoeflea olei TaxID=1480615 RepID=A0A1C1YZ88_9HYPH|nr:D-Ala-D-Ala carboxypeptidase family metallohydrolase [Hoeflea olei]OCW58841.1 hypothetical protein AWJ14_20875 [Hoeflea olei]